MNIRTTIKLIFLLFISLLYTGCEIKNEDTDGFLLADDVGPLVDLNIDLDKNIDTSSEKDIEQELEVNEYEDNQNIDEVNNNISQNNSTVSHNTHIESTETDQDNVVQESKPIFSKSEIPEDIKKKMIGKSMTNDASVSFDELSYLKISHIDYNGDTQVGEMIVNSKLADEVLDIFRDIYNSNFPIEKIKLIDDYEASDHKSMIDNNSSAFCYRTIAGTNKVSNHGLGVAIDINPFYNPHVLRSKGTVNPPEASKYVDRGLTDKGMIKEDDAVYKAFTSRGWKWGGHWNNPDYQHFEKLI